MNMTNREAGDFLVQNVLNFEETDSDYNQAVLRGAMALLLAEDDEVSKLIDDFMSILNSDQALTDEVTETEDSQKGTTQ